MTQQPFSSAALRGAVDLSGLSSRAGTSPASSAPGSAGGMPGGTAAGGGAQGTGGVPGRTGALLQASDATFESVLNASASAPIVLVLWTPQLPESVQHLAELGEAARTSQGRFQVVGVDIAENPGIMQAISPVLQQVFGQVSALPVVMGLLSGQPMPFYLGVQPMDQVDQLLEKFLEAAVTNGVAGRVDVSGDGAPTGDGDDSGEDVDEDELPPLHQKAYDAIEQGDWAAAVAAYEQALEQDAGDEQARLGLGQVRLLERTGTMDLAAVRQAAADRPDDVRAQIDAADLELVGGHVEDAFTRLIDTVRRTSDADRTVARTHLLGLFEVVGTADPRVTAARRALMSALY